ncbi:MAG: tetratricopeptide repeat protein [Gammaproteobacteria bacterium]|jgi:tetratricopeptide (TPR) repeat protein
MRHSVWLFVLLLAAAGPALAADSGATTGTVSAHLKPVPRPDLSRFEKSVQDVLRNSRQRFDKRKDSLSPADLAEAYGRLGILYQAQYLTDVARVCYENAVKLAPDDFRWQYLLAYVAQDGGDLEQAIAGYKKALSIHEYLPASLRLAKAYLAGNQLDDAQKLFEQVLQAHPENVAALAGMGRVALSRHDYPAAIKNLTEALKRDPKADQLHYPLALAYRQSGNIDKARAEMSKRGQTEPAMQDPLLGTVASFAHSAQYFFDLGLSLARKGDYEKAAEKFEKALELNPQEVHTHVAAAQAYMQLGKLGAAEKHLQTALRLSPDSGPANYAMGRLAEARGDDKAAAGYYRAALKSDAGNIQARYLLGNALMRAGEYAGAAEQYHALADGAQGDDKAFFLYHEGLARLGAGHCGEGLTLFETAHRMQPNDGTLGMALARTESTCASASRAQRQEALQLAEAIHAARENADTLATLAMAQAANGKFDDAVATQNQAVFAAIAARHSLPAQMRNNLQRYQKGQAAERAFSADAGVLRPAPLKAADRSAGTSGR